MIRDLMIGGASVEDTLTLWASSLRSDARKMVWYLRKVIRPQAHDSYRVLLKDDGMELEIGS